ncbi:MAG TPA: methyltransferase domain-containing protein [Solirubrobacteraceae bacterium]
MTLTRGGTARRVPFAAVPDAEHMKDFWDARARENAEYFVDNRLDYNAGDERFFWEQGAKDLDGMLASVGAPALRATDDVLDIGVGVGRLSRALAPRVGSLTGIDVSREMIARAAENLAEHDVRLIVGDGVSLAPLGDAELDVVVSLVVFQHIPDPQITLGYIREIGRVLRPGGWAVFQVSDDPDVHTRDYPRPSLLQRLLRRAPRGTDDPAWRGSAVSLDDVRAAAADGGMTVAAVSGEGTQYCIVRCTKP